MKKLLIFAIGVLILASCDNYKSLYEAELETNRRLRYEISDLEDEIEEKDSYITDLKNVIYDASDVVWDTKRDLLLWEDDPFMIMGDLNNLSNILDIE